MKHTNVCNRCLALAKQGLLRAEMVQPLPPGALAPLANDGTPQCHDCGAAQALMRFSALDFVMARVAVGNDRQSQYRLPGAPMGLVAQGLMRPSKAGDLDRHLQWLEAQPWFSELDE